jgi:D-alanine-D-alanine ligase
MAKVRVAVLMGGSSGEREISLSTGHQIVAALDPSKYTPIAIDPLTLSTGTRAALPPARSPGIPQKAPDTNPASAGPDALSPLDVATWAPHAAAPGRPDVAFIALHGRGGEDGSIQGMLDLLGIPYTGSGVLASALAMDKAMTKRLLRADGIPVPRDVLVVQDDLPPAEKLQHALLDELPLPVVVKPNREGSTIGCTVVREPRALLPAIFTALRHDTEALVEQFVPGIEITVGLLGNREPMALPIIEIVAQGGFYDYEAKYAPGGSEHIIPARISRTAAERARDYACRTHKLIGCRGMSRVDMIVADDQPYVLEINTIPGMTPTSLLPDAARSAGMTFPELLDRIIELALEGHPSVR